MGGLPGKTIAIFLVNELHEAARAAVRDGIDDETLNLERILDRARSVLSSVEVTGAATIAAVRSPRLNRAAAAEERPVNTVRSGAGCVASWDTSPSCSQTGAAEELHQRKQVLRRPPYQEELTSSETDGERTPVPRAGGHRL